MEIITTFDEVVEYRNCNFKVNRYERGKQIGKGGFSRVYEVRKFEGWGELFLGQTAILKQLQNTTRSIAELYENEVRILKALNGQYSNKFPQCISNWKATSINRFYIVFERCSYGSLRDLTHELKRKGRTLNELQIIFFLREIIAGVAIMQKLKMMHRDLKLDNIMIDQIFNVKIIDFGVSKMAEKNEEAPVDDRNNSSLRYMAPQMLRGEDKHSYEVDVWAIGVILYYLMFLKHPFEISPNSPNQMDQLLKQIESFNIASVDTPLKQLKEILGLLLQKDRYKRMKLVKPLLSNKLFERLQGHQDIAKIIQIKYQSYFAQKKQPQSNWLQPVQKNYSIQTNFPADLSSPPQLKATAIKFVEGKAIKSLKVKIIDLIHYKNYGFFVLLSNLTFVGYFNNNKMLIFDERMKLQTVQEKILYCMYFKHFYEKIKEMRLFDNELEHQQPQCCVKKLAFVKDTYLFVRLTNEVLQVFFNPFPQNEYVMFRNSFQFNNNRVKPNQITIVRTQAQEKKKQGLTIQQDSQIFENYEAVAASNEYRKHLEDIKAFLQLSIDNASLSFDKMNLKRIWNDRIFI